MARCTQFDSCPFSNKTIITSPAVTEFMFGFFCNDRFTKCRFYNCASDLCAETPDAPVSLPAEVIMWLASGKM